MRIVGMRCVTEKGVGWIHTIQAKITEGPLAGIVLTIDDDTDAVEVWCDRRLELADQDTANHVAAAIWRDNNMGTSSFRATGPAPREGHRQVLLTELGGVQFSHIA